MSHDGSSDLLTLSTLEALELFESLEALDGFTVFFVALKIASASCNLLQDFLQLQQQTICLN